MKVRDIFERNINRNINGVVKVSDSSEKTLQQELEEYVVTKELKPHFRKFFENFTESYELASDKMGVWISGFFGSGKSHFLKMLSYLLENKVVSGKKTIEYFRDKFDDPLGFSEIEGCCNKGTNKTILFNIDSLSGDKTKTAIKEVFAQVFYDSLGYFGRDIKVVRFEQKLDKLGKLQIFKNKFEEVSGVEWDDSRDAFDLYADLIIDALEQADIMSRQSAENMVYVKDTAVFNIDSLVDDIKAYVDTQDKNFRLIFMVDEIGQYIGEDMNLMLNLQTLVEDLGTKCKGKVWVIVTSQEAIDQVIKVKGDQFSKIMGRFDTRIHLTSSSVEEVVKKRLLAKNQAGENCLNLVYEAKSASLKNTFTFEQAAADLKGYSSAENFVEVYPFVPYQFRLFQNVLNALRTHDQAGFDTSDNSRNMLGAFRLGVIESKGIDDVIFEDLNIGNNNDGALFSFDRFFDTVSEKLNSTTRELIDRAIKASEEHNGIEKYDVCILKLLYLIRYVDKDIKATVNNISILMTDSIDRDQIALRKKVSESLERLRMQNYVCKNGEVYTFLSNEEKEVEIEIKNTHIDQDELSKSIGEIIFGDIFSSKKAKYGVYDFEFDRYVDDLPIGSTTGALKFVIITPGNILSEKTNEQTLMWNSMTESGKVICVLSNEDDFYEKFREVAKIEKYNKTKNQTSLAQAIKTAISARVAQAKIDRNAISKSIEEAVKNATFYIDGQKVAIKGATAKDKIISSLNELIVVVYKRLDMIQKNYNSPEEIRNLLTAEESVITGRMVSNPDAVADLETFLNVRYQTMSTVTVANVKKHYQDKPFGYKLYDIAAMIAELIIDQKVVLVYSGKEYKKNDAQVVNLLTNNSYIDSVVIKQRIAVDPVMLARCINIMKDFTGSMDVPTKEDAFVDFARNTLHAKVGNCDSLLDNYKYGAYPQKDSIEKAKVLYNSILLYKTDTKLFLTKIKEKETELLNADADMADIKAFFEGKQKPMFDSAVSKCNFLKDDLSFINESEEAKATFEKMSSIIAMDRPFSKIALLPGLIKDLETKHGILLVTQQARVLEGIEKAKQELYQYIKEYNKNIYDKHISDLDQQRYYVENANKILAVVALESKIHQIKTDAVSEMLSAQPPAVEDEPPVIKKIMTVNKDALIDGATLKTIGDVNTYVETLKMKLYKYIQDGGVEIK